jgi:hypothetical protein
MEVKKIVVCGDSFCTAHNNPVTNEQHHFSQILEDTYGYEVINLAHGGVSTAGICFQVQTALNDNELMPDVIIHGCTDPGRIEVPLSDMMFDPKMGLQNFAYPFKLQSGYNSRYTGSPDAPFFSGQLSELASSATVLSDLPVLSNTRKQAVRMYINFLYDANLKSTIDNWLYEYWSMKILQKNIILIPFKPGSVADIAYDFSYRTNGKYPRVYHTDHATQQELARLIHSNIVNQSTPDNLIIRN